MARPPPTRVSEVKSPRELSSFLDFPRIRYAGDPAWVPPLRTLQRRRLRPLLAAGDLRLLVVRRGDEVLGTISVLRDRLHEAHRGEATSFFGFFEAVDDAGVARDLLDAASDLARRWGARSLRGPRNLSRVEDIGLQVSGFDRAPPFLQGHHPPSYAAWIEAAGFTRHRDLFAYETPLVDDTGAPLPVHPRIETLARAVSIPGLEVRSARWRTLRTDLEAAHTIFVEAFRELPENTPMPRDQFMALARTFLAVSDRRLLLLATVDGRPAAFALCFPEFNEVLSGMGGRPLPLGWVRGVAGLRRRQTVSFKLLGVMPGWRSTGLHALVIREAVLGAQAAGYRRLEASIIDEGNPRMRHICEDLGCRVYMVYRVFERAL